MIKNADLDFSLAQEAAGRRNWADAVSAYERAVAADGSHWKARLGRALARHQLGDYQAAIVDLDFVLGVCPKLPEAWYSRAVSRKQLGDIDGALGDCDEAINLRSDYRDAAYLRAVCLKDLGRNETALEAISTLLAHDPGYSEARYVRATLYSLKGDFVAAAQDYDEYLSFNPRSYAALLLRGLASYYHGDNEAALGFLTRAIEIEPHKGGTYARRAVVFKALGQHQQAAADFATSATLMGQSQAT